MRRRGTGGSYQSLAIVPAGARIVAGAPLNHTFLLQEGLWRVEGQYRDAGGASSVVSGDNTVRHEPRRWLFEAVLRLRGEPTRVQHNRYEIAPFSPGARSTHWSAQNPAVGALRGRFVIAGDAILSIYASPTGRYRGFESIQQRDASHYGVRGTLLEEDKVLSTWALELRRV